MVWMTDTSAAAVAARAAEQLTAATSAMVTQGNIEAEEAEAKKKAEKAAKKKVGGSRAGLKGGGCICTRRLVACCVVGYQGRERAEVEPMQSMPSLSAATRLLRCTLQQGRRMCLTDPSSCLQGPAVCQCMCLGSPCRP